VIPENMERDRFYINPDTQDRVQAMYRVHLTMPAIHDGYVEIEASSESEAIEVALGRGGHNVDWACDDWGDSCAISVCCVEVESPPEGTILIEQGYCQCGANLDAVFEPDAPETTGDGISEG